MKDDFDVIVRRFPREDIRVYGVFDVHLAAKEHMEKEFIEFRDMILSDDHAFVCVGGDLLNNGIKSSISNVYHEVMRPRDAKRVMTELLKPLAEEGRILCGTPGNHERRSSKEVDEDIIGDIFCKLDIEDIFRENMCFLKLQFGELSGDGARNPTYRIMVTHGAGGGILTGGAVNRAERFSGIIDGIDLVMVGHTHKPFVTAPAKLVFDPHNNRVSVKPFRVVSLSPWMAYGGYAMQKLMLPSSNIPQIVTLRGTKKKIEVTM